MCFSWEYFIESGHTEYKQKCPHNLARCEDEENYFIKYYQYYPNKSEWVPVSVSISINSISRCSQTSNQSA